MNGMCGMYVGEKATDERGRESEKDDDSLSI